MKLKASNPQNNMQESTDKTIVVISYEGII